MIRMCSVALLALAGLLGATSSSQATVRHRHRVLFGPVLPCGLGFHCRIPLFLRCLRVPAPAVVLIPPPPVVIPPPMPAAPAVLLPPPGPIVSVPAQLPPVVAPPPSVLVPAMPAPPLTHQQFAQVFKPLPGRYEVTLIHPGSRCPVNVCFTLPEGCPRVRTHRRDLVFDYGRHEVHIRFQLGGRVRVTMR